ncbi:MAG: amidohydrolase [Sphingopyxis sp.]|nr:MAG: amidohydrolase [Sphingopyxis sp.]|tara:strand:+ start:8858 stop:10165 length:1308 start_codon:yes stop_codon:yes gene_type:complete
MLRIKEKEVIMSEDSEKFSFGAELGVDETQVGGWLVGAFKDGGKVVPAADLQGTSELTKGIKIIDVDTHFTERGDLWTSRMPASMKDRTPYMKREGSMDYWFIGDELISPAGACVIDKNRNKRLGRLSIPRVEDCHPAAYDVDARLKFMDDLGVHAQICYPNGFASSSVSLLNWVDKGFAEELIKVYNDDRGDAQKQSGGRLLPMALLPVWDSKAMGKEALRCVEEYDVKGFNLPDRPEQFGLPTFNDDHWAPLFELCNDKEIPINFHIATGGIDGFAVTWKDLDFQKKMAVGAMLFYIGNAATLANFIVSGLLDKYPKLKIVSVESGIGWIPFLLEALEYQVDEMMPDHNMQRRPVEYFKDQMFASFWFEKIAPSKMLDLIGPDNVMFETDFPHPTALYPDPQAHLSEVLADVDPAHVRKILQENAQRCYNIEL